MKEKQKAYIIHNAAKLSPSQIAKELGLSERSVKKFMSRRGFSSPGQANSSMSGISKSLSDISVTFIGSRVENSKVPDIFIYAAIFLLALVIRLIYLNQIRTSPLFEPFYRGLDDYLYDTWAREIASGKIVGSSAFYGLPLYPYFLAAIYKLSGFSVYAARLVQMLIGSLSAALFYKLGKRVSSRVIGLIMAVIMTFYLPAIFTEGLMASSSISIFLNVIVLLSAAACSEKVSPGRYALLGFLSGIASLANASVLVFLAIFLGFRIFEKKQGFRSRLRDVVVSVFFCLAAISPATIHNYTASKDLVPVTYHSGLTFFAGNNSLTKGSFTLPPELGTNVVDTRDNAAMIAQRVSGRTLKPSEISAFWFDQGLRFIKENPGRYAVLTFRKACLFWNAHEIPDIISMGFMKKYSRLLSFPLPGYSLISPLSILGLFFLMPMARANPPLRAMYMYLAGVFISTLMYFVNSRYILTAAPAQIFFASAGLYGLYKAFSMRKFKALAVLAAVLIFSFAFTQVKLLEFNFAQLHNNLGIVLKRKGLTEEAVLEYSQAIKLNQRYPSPHFNLGILYAEQGKSQLAVESFNRALEISPSMYAAHNELADVYYASGDIPTAISHLERSLEINPAQPEVRSAVESYRRR
ncbi:MAG TPA: tetratricopeptide repeat protein [Candidatus Omnitrophota bacterium]|nr:tetratricopeptide repeat protein [Candidatus Omnitrophota bacterium]